MLTQLRNFLIAEGLVRSPDVAGDEPPIWRHPDNGPVGPGDAAEQQKPATAHDAGLVVSLLWAPGVPPLAGEEERRHDSVDIYFRGTAVQPIIDLENEIRKRLLGDPPDPGGRADWVMDGRYVIQSAQSSPMQPLGATDGVFTFRVQYLFDLRVP